MWLNSEISKAGYKKTRLSIEGCLPVSVRTEKTGENCGVQLDRQERPAEKKLKLSDGGWAACLLKRVTAIPVLEVLVLASIGSASWWGGDRGAANRVFQISPESGRWVCGYLHLSAFLAEETVRMVRRKILGRYLLPSGPMFIAFYDLLKEIKIKIWLFLCSQGTLFVSSYKKQISKDGLSSSNIRVSKSMSKPKI